VFGICLGGVWDLSGRCLAFVWEVFGICLEACGLNVLSLRAEASESFSPGASGIRFSYFWCFSCRAHQATAGFFGMLPGPLKSLTPNGFPEPPHFKNIKDLLRMLKGSGYKV